MNVQKSVAVVTTPWTSAHRVILNRLISGLDALGARFCIQVGGETHGTLLVSPDKRQTKVNNFVAKYDYIKKIQAFNGGTLEMTAEPGEGEVLRAVVCTALGKRFDRGNYTTAVDGDLITIVAFDPKTAASAIAASPVGVFS